MNDNQNPQYDNIDMQESVFKFMLGTCIFSFITTIVSLFIVYFIQADTGSFYVPMKFESGGAYESIWIWSGVTFIVSLGFILRACKVAERKAKAYEEYLKNKKEEE